MSKTPVVSSGDVNVRLASHVSKVPAIATDAFTVNLTELSAWLTSKTGTCARLSDGSTADAKTQKTANRMPLSVSLSDINFLRPVAMIRGIYQHNRVTLTGKTASPGGDETFFDCG